MQTHAPSSWSAKEVSVTIHQTKERFIWIIVTTAKKSYNVSVPVWSKRAIRLSSNSQRAIYFGMRSTNPLQSSFFRSQKIKLTLLLRIIYLFWTQKASFTKLGCLLRGPSNKSYYKRMFVLFCFLCVCASSFFIKT